MSDQTEEQRPDEADGPSPAHEAPTHAGPAQPHLNPRLRARLARHPPGAREGSCADPPSPELLHGIEQFNRREYFECHETLEGIWNREPGPVRTLYKGILQVGVGCLHLLRGNYHGAITKLRTGADYLEPFAPRCMGVDVARLIADARRLHAAVVALGPERIGEVDLSLLPQVVVAP